MSIVQSLWQVANADTDIDKYEEYPRCQRQAVASAEEAVAAIRSGAKKRLRITNATGTRFVTVTPE